ncbi:MAG: DnaB-like helicase C-terminal domain-containing protein [Thermoguttaceae bacterium]|jgi:replicative DNA helicase|nr:DnaB-like helicase C-terminal domain-containing protein [Thermoguttaceae bacterium]
MTNAAFVSAVDAIDAWRDDLLSGNQPTFWPLGDSPLDRIELGPGLVVLLGGAPGTGKTSLAMQLLIDALRLTPTLRGLCCSVEMPPAVLLDRQLARLSGIDATTIRYRQFGAEHGERLELGLAQLEAVADRLAFVKPPFDLENVAASADAFHADVLLLDYIQRIPPPGSHPDNRQAVNRTMDYLRQFAEAGCGLLVVAAVGRTKDKRGRSSYDAEGLNLASFRETSELEFGADSAYILAPPGKKDVADLFTLRHLKARHGECRDLVLRFDKPIQRFTDGNAWQPNTGRIADALAGAWDSTAPAADDWGDR